MRAKVLAVALVIAAVMTAAQPVAHADDPHFDSGGNGFPAVSNFTDVTLNGLSQLTTASINPFVVIDDSGTLTGWNVTLTIPDFHNGTGPDCSTGATATLAADTISMNAPIVAAGDSQTDLTGVTSEGYTDFTSPRVIIDAEAGEGAGTFAITPQVLKLIIHAGAKAGAYCTLANMTIISGP
jgi:hypothetical protein